MSFDDDDQDEAETRLSTSLGRAMSELAKDHDPSVMGWPPLLVVEIALRTGTVKSICQDYGVSREEWDAIRVNPYFIAELGRTVEGLRTEGMAFKARAQIQASELLKESWRLIHDRETPANVKADLIKSTIRFAGLDASRDAALQQKSGAGFSIQINLL